MSHQNRLLGQLSERTDITLAKIGIIACLLLLGLRLLASQVLLVVIPIAIGTACLLYLGVQRRRSTNFEYPALPRWVIRFLPSVVFVGLAALVFLIHTAGGRTGPIYLLTGAIGAIILAQILIVNEDGFNPNLVLIQIIVAAIVIRMTALFATPGFIGVDIWTHVPVFIEGIVEAESLSAIADSKYIMAPFYHSIGAIAALVFGSARTGMYLSIGLLVPLSALFVYAAGKLIIPVRWALLATALYAFADQFIRWGLHVIPTSLGLVFFLGVLYCVTKLFHTDDLWVVGLLLAFSLSAVFTHQVSTAIVLVLLAVAATAVLLARLVGSQDSKVTDRSLIGIVGTFLTVLVITIVSWMNTSWYGEDPFLWQILVTLHQAVTTEASFLNLAGGTGAGGGTASSSVGLFADVIPFVEWFGFALLLSVAVVGGLTMLRMHSVDVTFTYLVTAGTMFVIVFGFSLFGVRVILPGRWIAFMYAPLAIVGAIGLYYLSQNASRRVIMALFVIVALGYPATMVVAEKATLDSPAFEDEYPRYSYTESEIAAVESISAVYPPEAGRSVNTDHPYRTLFGRYGGYSSSTLELGETGSTSPAPVIHREYQSQGPAIFHQAGEPTRSIASQTVDTDRVCSPRRNHVYANDVVKMCTSPVVEPGVGA